MTCTQERFERDVAEHTMTIHRDDGADRHITFKKPGTSCYWFEIVTWNGALCIRGDCGTYVFSRLTDMFEFFRTDRGRDENKLYINPQYWMEKIQAVNKDGRGQGSAEVFSADKLKREVIQWFRRYTESRWYEENRADRWSIWKAVRELLEDVDYYDESANYTRLRDFSVWNDVTLMFEHKDFFDDFWEVDCKEYDFQYLWNCYAISWAIRQYDAAKVASESDTKTVDMFGK